MCINYVAGTGPRCQLSFLIGTDSSSSTERLHALKTTIASFDLDTILVPTVLLDVVWTAGLLLSGVLQEL